MEKILFQYSDLVISERDGRFFARYDAGAHNVVLRQDEITAEEARLAARGVKEAEQMLRALQQRLIAAGVDPYVSNFDLEGRK